MEIISTTRIKKANDDGLTFGNDEVTSFRGTGFVKNQDETFVGDSLVMDLSASNLSLASWKSERSQLSDADPERLARSLSRIRIRRPSASVKVDLNGIVDAENNH